MQTRGARALAHFSKGQLPFSFAKCLWLAGLNGPFLASSRLLELKFDAIRSLTLSYISNLGPYSPSQKELIERENRFRHLFAEDSHNSELNNAHLLLQNVFETEEEFVFQDEDEEEVRLGRLEKRSGMASFLVWLLYGLCFALFP